MVSEIFIFTLAVKNLQFNCDHCNRTNSSEKGLTQHMWMKQKPSVEGKQKPNVEGKSYQGTLKETQ